MTRLSLYDPFAEVFPELFRGIMTPVAGASRPQTVDIKIDVTERNGEYKVMAEMPGVRKEDIQVQIDGNRVAISAEVKQESEHKEGERVLRTERYYGAVARSFQLSSELDDEKAEAKFENGVLTLTLPKKSAPAARRVTIN